VVLAAQAEVSAEAALAEVSEAVLVAAEQAGVGNAEVVVRTKNQSCSRDT
jgi:hypothetical protein